MKKSPLIISSIIVLSLITVFIINEKNRAKKDFNHAVKNIVKEDKNYLTVFGTDQINHLSSIHRIWAGKTQENSLKFSVDYKEILNKNHLVISDLFLVNKNKKIKNSEILVEEKESEYELNLSYTQNNDHHKYIIVLHKSEIETL